MPKKKIPFLLFTAILVTGLPLSSFAQFGSSSVTPIWGAPVSASPIWGGSEQRSARTFVDPIWNAQPQQRYSNSNNNNSQQQNSNSSIWNRQQQAATVEQNNNQRQANGQQTGSIRSLNISSRMDTLGHIVQDTTFINIGDSTVAVAGSINDDMDGILPPPDDPVDAPIDGGLGILLAIGLASGYNQIKRKKQMPLYEKL